MTHTTKRRQPRRQLSPGYAKLLADVIAELVAKYETKHKAK